MEEEDIDASHRQTHHSHKNISQYFLNERGWGQSSELDLITLINYTNSIRRSFLITGYIMISS